MNIKSLKSFFPILIAFIFIGTAACSAQGTIKGNGQPFSHEIFDGLLKKHVNAAGNVNYKGMIADSNILNKYIKQITTNHPTKSWSRNEQLAYWMNAYNAFTIQIVIRNYPVKSIKDIGPSLSLPFVNTVWDIKFINIEGENYDINNIEHSILRKMNEPRIHFAINCASYSCPKLFNEAYEADKLEAQLTKISKSFINDPIRNKITPKKAELSKIFSWFKGDFTEGQTLIEFINKYSDVKLNKDASIDYMDYLWGLNDQK